MGKNTLIHVPYMGRHVPHSGMKPSPPKLTLRLEVLFTQRLSMWSQPNDNTLINAKHTLKDSA